MKKIFSYSVTLFLFSLSFSQIKVPDAVKTVFNNKFPNASAIKWEKESKDELEANFKMNNTEVSANFKLDGTWVETETTIAVSELPAAVSNAVKTKYSNAVYGRTEKIERPGGKTMYEVNIKVNGKSKELELFEDGSTVK